MKTPKNYTEAKIAIEIYKWKYTYTIYFKGANDTYYIEVNEQDAVEMSKKLNIAINDKTQG